MAPLLSFGAVAIGWRQPAKSSRQGQVEFAKQPDLQPLAPPDASLEISPSRGPTMARDTGVGIEDTWDGIRANPVFRRSMLPRGLRSVVRSPFPRALLLTALALAIFEWATRQSFAIWPTIVFGVVFWFLIKAMQRYFCWMELTGLARTGTLEDYLNSGLTRADVAIGVVYPAVVAETVAIAGVMTWFLITEDSRLLQTALAVFLFLTVLSLRHPPFVFHPDLEAYMRKRNPISLFFIGFAVAVPLIIWFAIVIPVTFGLFYANGAFKWGLKGDMVTLAGWLAGWFLHRWPVRWYETWRLKRFYRRYRSFDDLFEKYIEQG